MAAEAGPHEGAHAHLVRATKALNPTANALRNGVSSHTVTSPVSLTALEGFCKEATAGDDAVGASKLFLGSLDGELVVSARLRAPAAGDAASRRVKKRARDDADERAAEACGRLRRLCEAKEDATERAAALAQLGVAQRTVAALLSGVRGPADEDVFEACGVNMAAPGAGAVGGGAALGGAKKPAMILACRLSAGTPISIKALRAALAESFRDGMLTTHAEALSSEYQLPLSDAGRIVENQGQRSILLFCAVAAPPPKPAVVG